MQKGLWRPFILRYNKVSRLVFEYLFLIPNLKIAFYITRVIFVSTGFLLSNAFVHFDIEEGANGPQA